MSRDDEHLQLLALFHYVVAILAALFSLFPTVHLAVGIALVSGAFADPADPFPFTLVGWFLILFGGCWIAFGLTFASCLAAAGRFLKARRHYQFCIVMAGLACVFMPFGTALGIFTILVLTRQDVREQFNGTAPER